MHKVTFPSSSTGEKITGTLFYPHKQTSKNPAILFIHGWRSDESGNIRRAKALAGLGYICLTINLRGHGTSDGKIENLKRKDFLNDTLDAFDFLVSQEKVDPERVGVAGSSLGGYLPILLASKRPVRWLALRCPANFPDVGFNSVPLFKEIENHIRNEWMHRELDYASSEALRAFHDFRKDILLIEGEYDYTVPHQTIANYLEAARDNKKLVHKVMKGVGHNLRNMREDDEFIGLLREWFASKV